MMKFFTIVTPSIVWAAMPVDDFRFPLQYDDNGRLEASVHVSGTSSGIHSMKLTTNDESLVASEHLDDGTPSMSFVATTHDTVFRVSDPSLQFMPVSENSYLGVGPRSILTRESGSVAVLKDGEIRAQLVIGASAASFDAACQSDSILTLNAADTYRWPVTIRLSGDEMGEEYLMRIETTREYRAGIPSRIFDRIVNRIGENGASRVESAPSRISANFTNCTATALETLPDLEFVFAEKGIKMVPEDYLDIDEDARTCRMRVSSVRELYATSFWFNPLMLVDMNVRFHNNHLIEICDSNGRF